MPPNFPIDFKKNSNMRDMQGTAARAALEEKRRMSDRKVQSAKENLPKSQEERLKKFYQELEEDANAD